eukprot:UN10276
MGGHGALVCYLKNPDIYKSCSAFSPVANPVNCPWGKKAFKNYLGEKKKLGNSMIQPNWTQGLREIDRIQS